MTAQLSIPLESQVTQSVNQHSRAIGVGIVMMLLLTALYALLQNPYWVRHGDSEVYLSLARNLATGKGYTFSGQPVGIVTPACPLILAGLLKITSSLAALKLFPMFCFLGFAAMSYIILLRLTMPIIAALCVITVAMLEPVFILTNMFFSDGPFALAAMFAVWWALRINDGADSWPRIAVLALLCALLMGIRWAGLFWFAVIAAALLQGELWPRANRRWFAFLICAGVTLASFFALQWALRVQESAIDPRYDSSVAMVYGAREVRGGIDEYFERFQVFGQWIGGLLWRPAQKYHALRWYDNLVGWALSLLSLLVIVPAAMKRQWLLLGAATYIVVLGAIWNDPLSRYIIPAGPFILLAAYQSIAKASDWFGAASLWLRPLTLNVFFASIFFVNGVLFAMNVMVMRSSDFYARTEGGVHRQLIDAAWYINQQPREGYEIAISQRWMNFGREYATDGYFRALSFLTARPIMSVPMELCYEPDADVVAWCTKNNVRYFLFQPSIWVFEQFHPKSMNGIPLTTDDTAWRLYEIKDGQVKRIMPDPVQDWPRNVPGI